ncbi:hypothetical protein GCM10027610_058930 [Dactylosporangium cerinum]
MVTSRAGCAASSRVSAAGSSARPPLLYVAMRSGVRPPASRSMRWRAAVSSAVTTSAASTSRRPASVSVTPRLVRTTTVVPTLRSSAATCCETADGVIRSAAAARLKLPCRATWCSTRSRAVSIISVKPSSQPDK